MKQTIFVNELFHSVKLQLDRMDALNLDFSSREHVPNMKFLLYPYHSVEYRVLFIYGRDYSRRMNILFISKRVQLLACLIEFFILLAMIVLCIIRKVLKLQRNDIFSVFIDTMIPSISGGNIWMDHKWEKWFFCILFGGAFFIMSLFTGDLLDGVYMILNQKISTFEQQAALNTNMNMNIPIWNSGNIDDYFMIKFRYRL